MSSVNGKSNLTSKTNWFNGVAISLLAYLIKASEDGNLPAQLMPYAAIIVAVGNLILRQLTNEPVKPIIPPVFALLAVLACGAAAMAAPPEAVITGPTGGVPGDLLVLDASQSEAEHYDWAVTPELPDGRKTILVLEEGKKCLVTSVPGTYTAFLAVSNPEGIDLQKWTVQVGDKPNPLPPAPNPNPPPNPQPNPPAPTPPEPNPQPNVPDGKFGIAKQIQGWAREVNSSTQAQDVRRLAEAADSVAAAISAGTLSGPREILGALRDANLSAVASPETWRPFGKKFETRLKELFESARLLTDQDWATLLREVAIGFRAVV